MHYENISGTWVLQGCRPRHRPSAPGPLDGDHEILLDGDHDILPKDSYLRPNFASRPPPHLWSEEERSSTAYTSVGATMLEGEGRPLWHQPCVEALFGCPCRRGRRRRRCSRTDPLRYALACCLVQPPGGNSLTHQRETEGFLSRRAFVGREIYFKGGLDLW